MGSAASSKNKTCKSVLPDEGRVPQLRQTMRDLYLDNFDSKALPLMPEENQRKSNKIQKRSRCELHPFELPDDSDEDCEDEGMGFDFDDCKEPASGESAAGCRAQQAEVQDVSNSHVSLKEGSEMIQKRKRCSIVPENLLQLAGSDSDASDSDDDMDWLPADLDIFEREMPRDTVPAQRGVTSVGWSIVLHKF